MAHTTTRHTVTLDRLRYLARFTGFWALLVACVFIAVFASSLAIDLATGNWPYLAVDLPAALALSWIFLLSGVVRQHWRAAFRQMTRYRDLMGFIRSRVPLGQVAFFEDAGSPSRMLVVIHSRGRNRAAEVVAMDSATLAQLEAFADGDTDEEIVTQRVLLLTRQLPVIHGQADVGKVRPGNFGEDDVVLEAMAPRSFWKTLRSRYSAAANGTAYADDWEIDSFLDSLRAAELVRTEPAIGYEPKPGRRDT